MSLGAGPGSIQVVYLSVLAPGDDYRTVSDIYRVARRHNAASGINGFLVFDGSRFCSLLDGGSREVKALCARIATDRRHTDYRVVLEATDGPGTSMPRSAGWRSGFAEVAMIDRIEALTGADADTILRAAGELARCADLDGWSSPTSSNETPG